MNIDPNIDMPARGGMLTGEMLHKAFWISAPEDEINLTWASISAQDKARYTAMADWLNVSVGIPALAHTHAQIAQLTAQITQMTETILRIEQERDAWQLLAGAQGIQQPAPTAQVLLEQERAAFHARMREMGIPFQEGDHA